MPKLTKRLVEGLSAQTKERILWDDELGGFGVRIYPTGRKVYVVQYRSNGRTRRKNLGLHGVLTADEARKDAKLVHADVARGADPSADRKARLRSPTVKELGERFISDHVKLHLKPTTQYDYSNMLKKVIYPALGSIKVSEITFDDIAAFHLKRRETPYQANRGVMVMSKMFNLAEDWGYRPLNSNPTRRIKNILNWKRNVILMKVSKSSLGKCWQICCKLVKSRDMSLPRSTFFC